MAKCTQHKNIVNILKKQYSSKWVIVLTVHKVKIPFHCPSIISRNHGREDRINCKILFGYETQKIKWKQVEQSSNENGERK